MQVGIYKFGLSLLSFNFKIARPNPFLKRLIKLDGCKVVYLERKNMKIKKNNYDNYIKRPAVTRLLNLRKIQTENHQIKSYHGPRDFLAFFLLPLEPQGG